MAYLGKKVLNLSLFVACVAAALYPIYFYPKTHIDYYKEAQKKNREGIDQKAVQPGGMPVWRDPFGRK